MSPRFKELLKTAEYAAIVFDVFQDIHANDRVELCGFQFRTVCQLIEIKLVERHVVHVTESLAEPVDVHRVEIDACHVFVMAE